MLELLFVIGFFVMLLVTGIKLLPWLLLAVVVVWVIRAIKSPTDNRYRANNRWRY